MEPDLLTRIASTPTLLAAFGRVRANHGCAGADGVSIAEYDRNVKVNLAVPERSLARGTYRPFPLFRILVEGSNGPRQLLVPTVRDRVAQAAALEVLNPLFEAEFERCSFGYRHGRSVRDAVRQIKVYYEQGYHWVVEADIDAYFDSVDQALLLARLRALLGAQSKGEREKVKVREKFKAESGKIKACGEREREDPASSLPLATFHSHADDRAPGSWSGGSAPRSGTGRSCTA